MSKQTNNSTAKQTANANAKASKPASEPKTGVKAVAESKGSEAKKGLSQKQVAVLRYLAKAKGWVGKAKVWYDCSAGTSVLGAFTRDGFGVQANGGLLALGLVDATYAESVDADGKGRVAYRLSAAGQKALAAHDKAAK